MNYFDEKAQTVDLVGEQITPLAAMRIIRRRICY
jgi:hypothetical protein